MKPGGKAASGWWLTRPSWRPDLRPHPNPTRRDTNPQFSELPAQSATNLNPFPFAVESKRQKNQESNTQNEKKHRIDVPCLTVCLFSRISWMVAEIFQ